MKSIRCERYCNIIRYSPVIIDNIFDVRYSVISPLNSPIISIFDILFVIQLQFVIFLCNIFESIIFYNVG